MVQRCQGKEADKLIQAARNCKKDDRLNEKLSPLQYDEAIKSQDPMKLLHLVRCLYNIKNERAKELRKMKSADGRMLQAARKLLYGEQVHKFNFLKIIEDDSHEIEDSTNDKRTIHTRNTRILRQSTSNYT